MPNEFSLIETYFAPLTGGNPAALGLKDDAALLTPRPGQELVITKDMLVEGTHFFPGDNPKTLAQKALRVNISDLAAKGATPLGYFLGLVLPNNIEESWIKQFAEGLQEDNRYFGIHLLGGDTTAHEGGVIISITALGEIPTGQMIRRSGAKPGDKLYVSGTLGDSALGLAILKGIIPKPPSTYIEFLLSRYYVPEPRLALGQALRLRASAAMDISDGLLQDAGHIALNSGVGIEIYAEALPLSDAAKTLLSGDDTLLEMIVAGGDDYELLCTSDAERLDEFTCIGKVIEGKGVQVLGANRTPLVFSKTGYQHL